MKEDSKTFRQELASWLDAHAPRSLFGKASDPEYAWWGGKKGRFPSHDAERWTAMMVERGLTVPAWPVAYGGAGLDADGAAVVREELARRALPVPLVGFGIEMLGPTLMRFGSEALKRVHLPKIARGEVRWCQGYSEPNAGSDLASLETSAVREGDHFVVNGQKIWTSYGDLSDWIFMLVRTDPGVRKQAGITFLLVDLDDPGIEIRPIHLISGASPFTETFFSNVRVPVANVVGEINAGWAVAKALLGFERNLIATFLGDGEELSGPALVDLARRYIGPAEGRLLDPVLRDRVTQLRMDVLCFQALVRRSVELTEEAGTPGPEASALKYYGTELNKRREELAQSIMGPQALGWDGPGYASEEVARSRKWLRSRGNSIEGGTSEVQLNIIARRVLGLP